MEVALGAIALATAVKDLIELAQKIHESFAKVSNNLRTAQRVAKDIVEKMDKIRAFCQNRKDTLDEMEGFRVALLGLLDKFRGFESSILPLLPKTGKRGLGLFVRGWWNNNKIEECILDLQSNIIQVMLEYMMDSAMRAEVKLETIDRKASKGLIGIAQSLEVLEAIRKDVSTLRTTATTTMTHYSYKLSGTTSDDLNRNIIMFAKSTSSTSAPMLRTPNVVADEVMTTAYIKHQINNIAATVEKMSMLPASPSNVNPFQLISLTKPGFMGTIHLQHHIVRQVTRTLDILKSESIHIISVQAGVSELFDLSIGLDRLGMASESILVDTWAATLVRLLLGASGGGQPDCSATLALCLLNLSKTYYASDDKIQGLQAIEEARTITENLCDQYSGNALFRILHSNVLLQYARLVNNKRSIKMSVEAIQVLEDILNIRVFTQSASHENVERIDQPASSFLNCLFSSSPPIPALQVYAQALQRLGRSLFWDGNSEGALDLQHLAIAVRRKIVSIHGQEHKVALAQALSVLLQSEAADHIPEGKVVDMADECIQLLRELAEKNPVYYAQQLVKALWEKASVLERLDRNTEAITALEEAASLAGQIVQDSELCAAVLSDLSSQFRRLKRHDDAVRTGMLAMTIYHEKAGTRAARYFYLSRDFRLLRRFKESGEAARTSVMLYRNLAMRDPRTWIGNLTEGLLDLAHSLAALDDHSGALIAWRESVSILDSLFDNDAHTDVSSDDIDGYCEALDIHQNISLVLRNDADCLEVCSTAVRYLRQLSEVYPQNTAVISTLLSAEYCYTYNMLRLGRLHDAQQYIDHWLDVWSKKPEAISESENATDLASKIYLKANVLDSQGCTEQALMATEMAQDIVRLSINTYHGSLSQMIYLTAQEAQLRVSLGNYTEALQVAEGALQLSRDRKVEPSADCLVWSLYAVALTASPCWNYTRVVEVAQEGCNIFATQEGLENWKHREDGEEHIPMLPRLLSLLSFAEANLGRCSNAVEYAHRAVDKSLEIGEMKAYVSATTAEHSYMETRGNLAEILLDTGDLAKARQICQERRAYFSKRVETRMGEYRELAPVLRMLGILCCSEGFHEEGDAAAQELSGIIKTLGSAFPSLLDQVKIRLRHQAQVPILKVLDDMSEKLDCGHQTEIVSLFAV